MLALAGCPVVEVASFVSPSRVPAMANSGEVVSTLNNWRKVSQLKEKNLTKFSALTPNLRGFNDAVSSGIDEVAVFGAASESFSMENIQCSIQYSLDRLVKVFSINATHF
jgi:hydroxymethylglutaryl-CoA lyase